MKTTAYIVLMAMLLSLVGCNFLDIMPDEVATEEDAFKDAKSGERYLYSCYSYIPRANSTPGSLDMMTADEVVTPFEHETFANFPKGNYNAANTVISYWNSLYNGIRQCYLFLENVDRVPNLTPETVVSYKAETRFLLAYYHHLLMRCYGPTTLLERYYPLNSGSEDWPERASYDRCTAWVDSMYVAASRELPATRFGSEYGLATSVAALAMRSRLLLFAASPLFNGDQRGFYSEMLDSKGNHLISQTYDGSKWARAATAAKEAIDLAEGAGYALYEDISSPRTYPKPDDHTLRSLRLNFIDAQNSNEVLWADCRLEAYNDLQNKAVPRIPTGDGGWNGVSPTLRMVEYFYTENGLPIDQDAAFDYAGRYGYAEYHIRDVVDGVTMNLNMHREPRFYSWISFHNGYFEIARDQTGLLKTLFRKNDVHGIGSRTNNYSPGGYLSKKGVTPAFSSMDNRQPPGYPWPTIRLAELYLNYAEALIEQPNPDLATARIYIDKVRTRAGLPGVAEAWAAGNVNANAWDINTVAGMREVVRRERTIELFLEGQRFWDLRRWGIADSYLNESPKGMNIDGATDAEFFQVVTVKFQRSFRTPAHFLMPIPHNEIEKTDYVIVQNPGY